MPEGRYAEIVILVEDAKQARFIRAWLTQHLNVSPRKIRDKISPKGGGAGEQFVRERLRKEAVTHKQKASHRGALLIAVIDADNQTTERRYRDILDSIDNLNGVFVFVPKRNIETWLRALNGFLPVDEDTDFKRMEHGDVMDAGLKFLKLIRSTTTEN